ncbi:MAG: 30S ribosomal protein S1 [Legionellales bacterium]|jgi:small subunit ribosomal protein S1|nr:30S ribosomal protein S1 [Legionellales bacterium]
MTNTTITQTNFNDLIEENLKNIVLKPGKLVTAKVVAISSDYITVDAGLKSESDIPTSEFMTGTELNVSEGDDVEVLIEQIELGDGITYLSREKAHKASVWAKLEAAKESGELIVGLVSDRVKGGFTVDIDSVRAFLPGSQADVRPSRDNTDFEPHELEFKIINMDKKRNNIVVSRRAVLESSALMNSEELQEKLVEGNEVSGIIKNLTDYGAFVDLGGLDGLLHITDISWKRVKHPSEVLEVGQELKVKVLSFDKDKNRVSLGLKQLCNDPWHGVADRYQSNSRVFGEVTNITDYGCFVEIETGIEGLVHMSEMDWTNKNIRPNKIVNVGDEVEVMIIDVDENKRRISLGIKQCIQNPWLEFSNNHEIGEEVSGTIKSITDFGVFVGLEGGIDGLVHLTDVSWVKTGEEVIRDYKKGDDISAKILTIDPERERISLSIKETSDDPFVKFFEENKGMVKGTVTAVESKKVIVSLADDISGTIRDAEFDTVPSIGDEVEAYIASHERKGCHINLTLDETNLSAKPKSESRKSKAEDAAPSRTTFGDLIKDKISKSDEG